MTKARKLAVFGALGAMGLLLVLAVSALLVVQSDWFREKVRQRIVYEVEEATGGQVEIGAFSFDWRAMRAEVRGFVLRGTEPPEEPPLFRARSVAVGLKLVSALRRDIDIASLVLEEPQIRITVDENGRTNFPQPKVARRSGSPVEQFLALAVRQFRIEDGVLEFGSERIPLNVRGENLKTQFSYEAQGPRYQGEVSFNQLQLEPPAILPVAFDADFSVGISGDRIEIPRASLSKERSSVQFAGAIEGLKDPRANFDFQAELSLAELGKTLRLPIEHRGSVKAAGKIALGGDSGYLLTGRLTGTGLAVTERGMRIAGIRTGSDFEVSPGRIRLSALRVAALGGDFRGTAVITGLKRFRVDGELQNVSLREAAQARDVGTTGLSGLVSGLVNLEGEIAQGRPRDVQARARLAVAAEAGDLPLQGSVDLVWEQKADTVEFRNSYLATPSSRVQFNGKLGQGLRFDLESNNLNDVVPLVAMWSGKQPEPLPLILNGGAATFQGVVLGQIEDAQVSGRASLTNFAIREHRFDRLTADVTVSAAALQARNVLVEQGKAALRGNVEIGLQSWQPRGDSTLHASISWSGLEMERVSAITGRELGVRGTASGRAELSGTLGAPHAAGTFTVNKPSLRDKRFDRFRAEFRYAGNSVEVLSAQLEDGSAQIVGKGSFSHQPNDWRNGKARFELSGKQILLSQLRELASLPAEVEGRVDAEASGEAVIEAGIPRLTSLQATVSLKQFALDQKPAGDFTLKAQTKDAVLTVRAEGALAGARITGQSAWRLEPGYPGQGELQFTRLEFSSLRPWLKQPEGDALPIDGFVEGKVDFSGNALEPKSWKGRMEIAALEIRPKGEPSDALALRNAGPLLLELDSEKLRVESARLVGTATSLQATGTVTFRNQSAYQLRLFGDVNLSVLQNLEPSLTASGDSTVDATIRGPLAKPEIYGQLKFTGASFYLSGVPNGIDKASGLISFFRDRATIENVTAETGGGKLSFNGFVGFGGEQWSYQLRATADDVRVRYPEGVSTTLDAALTLAGTASRSTLSGTVTVLRSGISPRVDIGALLARSERARVMPATQNELLRNMQFDVRLETSPDARFETTLTRDIQAEADLRVRGTPYKPVLLGRISITGGEINFLGNRYFINRGDVSFLNPVKLEPVLNLDLETRVRGIDVTMTFSGPPNKLNVTYRSDPPLHVNEIIALLAVGRAPATDPTLTARQAEQDVSWGQIGASTLIGQALAAPVAGRLQRFFGVSRIKIDPRLTGVENNPQAQLTLEQQVSRDITFTYITNLSQGQEQVVRVEWNVNRQWSLVAVREENGLFGVDVLFRKQFK